MTDPLLAPAATTKVALLRQNLPHATLLTGEPGVGLATISRYLAGRELAAFIEPIRNKDDKEIIDHHTGTIAVAVIRSLYDRTRSKSTTRQVFIIDDADRMSPGASAAFLKLLEEPTESTHFILTSHTPQKLLPTIRSRLQATAIEPLTPEQTKRAIDELNIKDSTKKTQLRYLADGLPAELSRLTSDDDYFKSRAKLMADTRTFLTGTRYQRLLIIHEYYQDKLKSLALIDSALMVAKRSFAAKPQSNLASQLGNLLMAREKIVANGNVRLQLLAFVVQ